MSADVLFSSLKIGEEQKKICAAADVLFFTDMQHKAKQKEKKVFGLIHDRSSYFCKCPRAAKNGLTGRTLPTSAIHCNPSTLVLVHYSHFYITKKLSAIYVRIAKLKIIIQKIQYHEQREVYFSLCSM